jgi:hypothetical protein
MTASTTRGHSFITPVVEHWDGARWSIVPNPAGATAFGFAGVAARPGATWVVGQGELTNGHGPAIVQRWDGSRWAQVASPSPGTLSNELRGVAALGAKDVWAVGSSASGTLSEHWDGSGWRVVPTPNGSTSDDFLRGVAGTAANDVWAVGSADVGKPYPQSLIEHWDGSTWSLSSSAGANLHGDGNLYGVAAITPTDAWAVGAYIAHWDGASWSVTPQPQFQFSDYYTTLGVAAVASNDVWAVGGVTTTSCGDLLPALIEHWDGAKWTQIPNLPGGILRSISAVSATDIWAVGGGLVLHWDGKKWSPATSGLAKDSALVGVSARAAADVWAIDAGHTSMQHWNGNAWTATQAKCSASLACGLNSLAIVSAVEAWAVGATQTQSSGQGASAQQQALIMRYIA